MAVLHGNALVGGAVIQKSHAAEAVIRRNTRIGLEGKPALGNLLRKGHQRGNDGNYGYTHNLGSILLCTQANTTKGRGATAPRAPCTA